MPFAAAAATVSAVAGSFSCRVSKDARARPDTAKMKQRRWKDSAEEEREGVEGAGSEAMQASIGGRERGALAPPNRGDAQLVLIEGAEQACPLPCAPKQGLLR